MIKSFIKRFSLLSLPDATNIVFLLFLSLLSIIFSYKIPDWYYILITNCALTIVITFIVSDYEKGDKKLKTFWRFIRYWYIFFMIIFCFKEIYVFMIYLTPGVNDALLIKWDNAIFFGHNPNLELDKIKNPWLTEFLQIVYVSFYLMPYIYTIELFVWHRYEELKYAMFVLFFGFYLSFIGYLFLPAIGPRFTLFDFTKIDLELPGLWLTTPIRNIIDLGESIPHNVTDPENYAQRDAFPSGHTMMIICITYLSWKIKSKSIYFYLPYCILMIFSTVYLRYHYAVDLISGAFLSLVTIMIANHVYKNRGVRFGN
ncbi:phosphatase PAP2 family protein [soil metagenome]